MNLVRPAASPAEVGMRRVAAKVPALSRILLAAVMAWTIAVSAAGVIVFSLSGANLHATVGLTRPALDVAIPAASPAAPAPVAPAATADFPWVVPLTGVPGWVSTGTLVTWEGRRTLMTASHAVQYAPFLAWLGLASSAHPLVQRSANGRDWPLGWGRITYDWDLAIYPAPEDGTAALNVRQTAPALGETVRFVGYPFWEAQPWAATGPVTAVRAHPSQSGAAAVLASIEPSYGQSGGALVDLDGQLVGIGVALTPWGVLAVGSGAVEAVLAGHERLHTPEPPSLLLRFALGAGVFLAATGLTLVFDRAWRYVFRRVRVL